MTVGDNGYVYVTGGGKITATQFVTNSLGFNYVGWILPHPTGAFDIGTSMPGLGELDVTDPVRW